MSNTVTYLSGPDLPVGTVLFVGPRPWWMKMWHFLYYRVFRCHGSTFGTYTVTKVVDQCTVTIDKRPRA